MTKSVILPVQDELSIKRRQIDDPAPVVNYLNQLNTLILTRHVILLMIEVQKHRGASMAVLAGNREFAARVSQSQRIIHRYLEIIQQLNQQAGMLISEDRWQSINHDWQALIEHWQTDPVMTNFEFHNHFIDSMVKLIWEQVCNAHLVAAAKPSEGTSRMLLTITLKLMPELLENIARVRGLATHVCSLGRSDAEFDSRFISLLHALNINKEKMRTISKTLQHNTLRAVPSLPEILLHDHKLDQLQQTVGSKIIGVDGIELSGKELFRFASEVIESYAQVIHDGITYFRSRAERQLGTV